jgi:tetratricopeptide (TPR) repeat protein
MQLLKDGKYAEGIEELKLHYEIEPHPNFLFDIARAYVDLGDIPSAIAYYERYLEGYEQHLGRQAPDAPEIERMIQSLRQRVERRALRSLADAYAQREDFEDAIDSYRQYLASAGPRERVEIERIVIDLRQRMNDQRRRSFAELQGLDTAPIVVESQPAGASVRLWDSAGEEICASTPCRTVLTSPRASRESTVLVAVLGGHTRVVRVAFGAARARFVF